ncbi:unnamed protein product [Lasius platythorax]|uniref:RRM domain-containing protein n=1 Tax=Lasius platythorax TaxID=488582 RepID=A0AAV2MWQ2_9HYME
MTSEMTSDSVIDDNKSSCSGPGSITLSGVSHAPASFLSSADIGALRKSLLVSRANIKKIMMSSKDAKEKRKLVEESLDEHYDAFNSMTTAYIQVVASMHTINSIRDMMHEEIGRACSYFLRPEGTDGTLAKPDVAKRASYTDVASKETAERVCVPKGPSVTIRKTINLVIGPTNKAVGRYTSSQKTKDAVLNAVNPSKVGLRVSRLTKARNNAIRIEACEADLDRLRASPGLKVAGLEVKKDVMLNPRVIIYGVPSVLSSDEIRSQLAEQDVDGAGIDDIRVVYRYPAHQGKSFSSCVVEIRSETRSRFISAERVFLGWSACKVADHVKVLQGGESGLRRVWTEGG